MYKKLENTFLKVDVVLITSKHHIKYYGGAFFEGALIFQKDKRILLTDGRYTEEVENYAKDFEIIKIKTSTAEALIKQFKTNDFKKIGFEDQEISYGIFKKLSENLPETKFIGISKDLDEIRAVKEEWEIENLKTAQKIAEESLTYTLRLIKPGVSEIEIAAELEYRLKKAGSDGVSFPTIVLFGARTSLPHGIPTNKKIQNGEFVLIDFGCIYKGYSSDMTRTFVLGSPSKEQKKIYDLVKEAQKLSILAIKARIRAFEVDKIARDFITKAGYGEFFIHSTGHGVGLLIHEFPHLNVKSQEKLLENNVVTIEPGIYIKNLGGVRIEDMVIVKENGYENLNNFTKELIEL